VWAAAEVDEVTFAIKADRFVGRNRRDDLRLVLLADRLEVLHGVVALPHLARDLFVLARELGHLFFDRFEIFRREGPLVRKVVIKAVFDHRPDRHLRIGEQLLHRVREQVRRRMTQHVDPVFVLVRHDRDLRVAFDQVRRIDQLAVHAPCKCGLGEAGSYRRGDVGDADGVIERALRAVWQLH
jgi:hypothetical protein